MKKDLRGIPPEVFGQAGFVRVVTGKYTQLSLENRYQIKALLDAGHNQSEIARSIGARHQHIAEALEVHTYFTRRMPLKTTAQ